MTMSLELESQSKRNGQMKDQMIFTISTRQTFVIYKKKNEMEPPRRERAGDVCGGGAQAVTITLPGE